MNAKDLRKAELLGIRLMQISEGIHGEARDLFKSRGLSAPQYNVLRILRGAGAQGLRCQEISDRMLTRVPDITRLLDRLGDRKFITRRRSSSDRRVVVSRITSQGLTFLRRIDGPLQEQVRTHFAALDGQDLDQLNTLLEKLEAGIEYDASDERNET